MKKNWKKVLLTITAVLVAAGLAGCGKGNATGNTAGQTEQQAESTKEQKNQSQTEDTGKKELRLEDFLEEETAEGQSGLADGSSLTEQLEAMAAQVKEIRELSGTGHPADQIASMLGMDGQQVRDILVCMQSFPEDDPLAVARLIVLG